MPPDKKEKIKKSKARQFESGQYFIIIHECQIVSDGDGGKEEALEALNDYLIGMDNVNLLDFEILIGEKFRPVIEVKDLEIVAPI